MAKPPAVGLFALEDQGAKALADETRFEPWRAGERMSLDEALDFLGRRLAGDG